MKARAIVATITILIAMSLGALMCAEPVCATTWDLALGWDFECHSHTHASFAELTDAQIRWELEQVNTAFAAHGYAPPQHHAYPYGDYDSRVENAVSQHRRTGRTVWGEMMTYPVTDWYEMMVAQLISKTTWSEISTWIDNCIATRALLHIFTHDVSSTPSQWGCTPAMLVRLLDYLVQKQNAGQLTVMTMAEAYDYWSSAKGGKATVVVSFDDANESDYTVVYPLFKARGLKGTSYIVTGFIGDAGLLTWDEIAKMRAAKLDTEVVFSFSQNPAKPSETVTLSGTLKDIYGNPVYPASVKVKYKSSTLWTLTTNTAGQFSKTFKAPTVGTYTVSVSYAGSPTYNPSSHTETLKVQIGVKVDTTINFMFQPNPANHGQTVKLLGILKDVYGNPVYPAQVRVYYSTNGGVSWNYIWTLTTNIAGEFSRTFTAPSVGTYLVGVLYPGSTNYKTSSHVQKLTVQ